jgi:hypothetical protein
VCVFASAPSRIARDASPACHAPNALLPPGLISRCLSALATSSTAVALAFNLVSSPFTSTTPRDPISPVVT